MISLFDGEALGVNTNNDPHIGKVNFKEETQKRTQNKKNFIDHRPKYIKFTNNVL